ncbi:MAG: glycosyltransferase [Rikenellaceae bacterium]
MRLRVFVSAYACEPSLGSEIGVGWHWVVEMSKYFDLWVLTRESNRARIECYLKAHPMAHPPHFVYYDLPRWLRFWKRGLRGVRIYYMLWQRLTNTLVRRTMKRHDIEIYHLLTYGNALWSASRYGQRQRFIWGPIGVGSYVPKEFIREYGLRDWAKETFQRLLVNTLKYNRRYINRCRDAALILCKTEQAKASIPSRYRHKAVVFTDVAVELLDTSMYAGAKCETQCRYLAVGRLEAWRGFDMMIEAFALSIGEEARLRLDILGDGTDMKRLKALISKLNLEGFVTLHGQVSMERYYRFMADCDVVINPTLKEGAVTTAFDALAFGKPLICIDTGGYTRYFDNEYSVVLKISPRPELVASIRRAILRLKEPQLRASMTRKIEAIRGNFTWERKGQLIAEVVRQVASGGCEALRFSNSDSKEWIIPLRSMSMGLMLYQPSGFKGRVAKMLLAHLYRLPIVRRAVNGEIINSSLPVELSSIIRRVTGCNHFEFSIFEGTPSSHQKRTIQIFKGGRVICYCKVSSNAEVKKLLFRESQILRELSEVGVQSVPRSLFCDTLSDGTTLFIESTRKSRNSTIEHRFTSKHRAFLEELHTKTATRCRFCQSDIYRSISRLGGEYADIILSLRSHYGDREHTFSAYHGDFTPWNTIIEEGELFTFDLEYAQRTFPPRLDRFHFFTQQAICCEHLTAESIYRNFVRSELRGQTIDYTLYLLHMISLYTHRDETPSPHLNVWRGILRML